MVKNFSKTIFTIVFVVFLGLSFIEEVSANFTCKVGNYTLEYNTSGELKNVTNSSGNKVEKNYENYFHPKSSSDCPDKKGYTVDISIIDGGRTFAVGSPQVVCKIGNYTLKYNTSGELTSVINSSGNKVEKNYESYFSPTSQNQCPDKTGYTVQVSIIDGGRTFSVSSEYIKCSLGGYTILYNKDGSISSASKGGSKVDKNFESYFKPTSPSACPSESEAKVYFIDGRRTFYVGKIDEELGASNTPENPQEPEEPSEPGTYAEDIGKLASGTDTVSCGTITDIPASIPKTVNIIYKVIQIFVPLVLIIFGMIDMAKAVMGSKEDEIKKGQQTLIKRIIAAAIVFFVFAAIKLVVSIVSDSTDVTDCMNCFIDNQCTPEAPVTPPSGEEE